MTTARREFMRNVGIGSAAVVGSSALGATLAASGAGAQSSGAGGDITPADKVVLSYLEGVELAAAAALSQAINRHLLDASAAETCRTFSNHNTAHASALAALDGGATVSGASPNGAVLSEVSSQIQAAGTAAALLGVLAAFAERVAATSQSAMGELSSLLASGVVCRISPVDAQQAAVLGDLAGLPPADWLPITQPTAGAFLPAGYPA